MGRNRIPSDSLPSRGMQVSGLVAGFWWPDFVEPTGSAIHEAAEILELQKPVDRRLSRTPHVLMSWNRKFFAGALMTAPIQQEILFGWAAQGLWCLSRVCEPTFAECLRGESESK